MQMILPALRVLLFALATISLVPITGCGLKGDLVLPGQTDPSPSAESAGAESDEPDESEGPNDGKGRPEARS